MPLVFQVNRLDEIDAASSITRRLSSRPRRDSHNCCHHASLKRRVASGNCRHMSL